MDISVLTASTFEGLASELTSANVSFVSVHSNVSMGVPGSLPPQLAIHGATSCMGAMTQRGVQSDISAFVIDDPDGSYGTALCDLTDGARSAARSATKAALKNAERIGEVPDLVWISSTPGQEEDVLLGIADVLGQDVPIIGGSAADNAVAGDWFVFDSQARSQNGVVISVLFTSTPVSFAYQNGHSPTDHRGTVTKVSGRTVLEIDGRPASEVYQDWTDGTVLGPDATSPKTILSESTLFPLGRRINEVGGVPFFLLAHPAASTHNSGLDLFATVSEGEEVTQMNGTEEGLVQRAERVANLALSTSNVDQGDVAGALVIYCGGCMLQVRDRLDDVVDGINTALGGAPFLGAFTFGEQGPLLRAGNRHGNLMISCIVFGA